MTGADAQAGEISDEHVKVSHRRRDLLIAAIVVVALYLLVPRIGGLEHTWERVRDGSPAWLLGAVGLEALSFAGYVWLLQRIAPKLTWRDAWRLTLAGVAATRIVTVAGAGGIAVTIAGLRRAGYPTREAAEKQTVDLVVLYGIFFALMVVNGLALAIAGRNAGLSLLPAVVGTVAIVLALAVARVPDTWEQRLRSRRGRIARALAAFPSVVAEGVRGAGGLIRARDAALLGGVAWWVFDVAALWASMRAFGGTIGAPDLLMAYLAGRIFNILPVPGGVGPVEGGTIAVLVALGEPAGLALVGVLAYQLVSVWLPALPGAIALARLRKTGMH